MAEMTDAEARKLFGLDEKVELTTIPPETVLAEVEALAEPKSDGPNMVMNPLTSELVDLNDIDSVIQGCVDIKEIIADAKDFDAMLRERAVEFTTGDKQTRRIRGKKLQAKIVMGTVRPVNAILKEAWQAYPQFRDGFLKISSISMQKRETKKLVDLVTDDKAFESFASMVLAAEAQGTEGAATVTAEEVK